MTKKSRLPASPASLGLTLERAPDGHGVIVGDVDPDSDAAKKGIRPGDMIIEVAGIEVDDPAAVTAAIRRSVKKGKRSILMLIESRGNARFVALPVNLS